MATCIWSRGRTICVPGWNMVSFAKLWSLPCGARCSNHNIYEHPKDVLMEFPELKHIHLQQATIISKMFAPELETTKLRGWSLKRIPATVDSHPVVDCEKD
uniref:Uncharacterized protein n=1 Tax=Oryza punctata TaxID=4537 RepID=A0A0E0KMR0_ORYPU